VEYICAETYDHDFKMWDRYLQLALDKLLPLKRKAIYPGETI
jgi:putative tributyrin esterase